MEITYSLPIMARCPSNGHADVYTLLVVANEMILVERILEVAEQFSGETLYQEELTQKLADELDTYVQTTGNHFGVETVVQADADKA
jgi:GTP cyclohydrolase I